MKRNPNAALDLQIWHLNYKHTLKMREQRRNDLILIYDARVLSTQQLALGSLSCLKSHRVTAILIVAVR